MAAVRFVIPSGIPKGTFEVVGPDDPRHPKNDPNHPRHQLWLQQQAERAARRAQQEEADRGHAHQ